MRFPARSMKLPLLALAAILPLAIPAAASDASAVVAASRQRVQAADFRASGHLVRVDADGQTLERRHYRESALVSRRPARHGRDYVPSRSTCPYSARDAPQWAKCDPNCPSRRQDSLYPAFDKWTDGPLGTGFSYEDFLEAQYFWPSQAVEETKYGMRDCDLLKSFAGLGQPNSLRRDQILAGPQHILSCIR